MKHEATHTGERFKAVVCKYCGKTVEYTKVSRFDLLEDSHGSFPAEEPRVDSHRGKAIQGKEFGWRYVTV